VLVAVEGRGDGEVADGVGRDLPATPVRPPDQLPQLVRVALQEPGVAGVVGERRLHGGGAAEHGAVREDLERSDPERLVAQPGGDPQVEAERGQIVRAATGLVQGVSRHHERRAHVQASGRARRGVGRELARAPRHEARTDARLLRAGDALRQVLAGRPVDRAGDVVEGVRVDEVAHERLRRLEQQPGRPAGPVPLDLTAGGDLGRVDADLGEHRAVDDGHVAGGVPQPDAVARRDGVELLRARVAPLGEPVLVVAGADDPAARREVASGRGHRVVHVRQALHRRRAQRQLGQRHPEEDAVVVRVVEAGDDRGAAQLDRCGPP
jgi:hypothetical protein